jgi:hypothetical protein
MAPWGKAVLAHFTPIVNRAAALLLAHGQNPATNRNYGSKLRVFVQFCREERRKPLQCGQADGARFVCWLAQRGSVRARNFQPYLSCVNQLYEDLGLAKIATGPLIVLAKRAAQIYQRRADSDGELTDDDDDEQPWLPAIAVASFVAQAEVALLPPPVPARMAAPATITRATRLAHVLPPPF